MTDKTRVQIELDPIMVKLLDATTKLLHSTNRAETIRRCVLYVHNMQSVINELEPAKDAKKIAVLPAHCTMQPVNSTKEEKRFNAITLNKITKNSNIKTAENIETIIYRRCEQAAKDGRYSASFGEKKWFPDDVLKALKDNGFNVEISDTQRDGFNCFISWVKE